MSDKVALPIIDQPVSLEVGACGDSASDALDEAIHPALESKHDFAAKFRQQEVLDRLKEYVRRQARLRREGLDHDVVDWEEVLPDQAIAGGCQDLSRQFAVNRAA